MSATIEVSKNSGKQAGVFLVNFTNGQLQPSTKKKPKFSLFEKCNDKTKKIMVAETDQLMYMGTNYDEDNSRANVCKYYVGALDRESGSLTLHRAELMSLKPYIPGVTDAEPSEALPSEDRRTMTDQMVASFGSERQKRAHAAAKRNRIETSALEVALESAVTHAKTEAEKTGGSQDVQSVQVSSLIPPHNPKAEAPQDVYDLSDIISLAEMTQLKKSATVFTKASSKDVAQWRRENRYPEFVLQRVASLPRVEPQRSLKATVLLYSAYLIHILNMHPKALEKRGVTFEGMHPPPMLVKEQLLLKFVDCQGERRGKPVYSLSSRTRDKALSHLFVLALILDDFSLDCTTLQQDLHIPTQKLMDHFRALGCLVMRAAVKRKSGDDPSPLSSCTAILRIPLTFPTPGKSKGRRRGT